MDIGKEQVSRLLGVPDTSFFLFGARGTGKSTWLRSALPDAIYLDLLDASLQLELTADPHRLEALIGAPCAGQWIVLDEVQKIPPLLSEVHRLIEAKGWRFALCGSSARQLKRGGADLLAGRAVTLSMEPFCSSELGPQFDLEGALDWGLLPVVHAKPSLAPDVLSAYVNTYLREEIKEEGAVRNFAPFVRFLAVAGMLNGQPLNAENIAREAQVPRSTVDGYFELLVDTLLGFSLPAYRPGLKVREAARPKFYWLDSGIARACAGLLRDPVAADWRGTALETLIFHELRVRNTTSNLHRPLSYYRTAGGAEIDFIVETRKRQPGVNPQVVCIEVKHAERWQRKWERPMRDMSADDRIETKRMIGVYRGSRRYRFGDMDVLPVEEFLSELHEGLVF
jgi:predicted AAA+ superfamily ATPase